MIQFMRAQAEATVVLARDAFNRALYDRDVHMAAYRECPVMARHILYHDELVALGLSEREAFAMVQSFEAELERDYLLERLERRYHAASNANLRAQAAWKCGFGSGGRI